MLLPPHRGVEFHKKSLLYIASNEQQTQKQGQYILAIIEKKVSVTPDQTDFSADEF